jgi:hypothetical protein
MVELPQGLPNSFWRRRRLAEDLPPAVIQLGSPVEIAAGPLMRFERAPCSSPRWKPSLPADLYRGLVPGGPPKLSLPLGLPVPAAAQEEVAAGGRLIDHLQQSSYAYLHVLTADQKGPRTCCSGQIKTELSDRTTASTYEKLTN